MIELIEKENFKFQITTFKLNLILTNNIVLETHRFLYNANNDNLFLTHKLYLFTKLLNINIIITNY